MKSKVKENYKTNNKSSKPYFIATSKNKDKIFFVTLKTDNNHIECLIDTGANDNFIAESTIQKLQLHNKSFDVNMTITEFNGVRRRIYKAIKINFSFTETPDIAYEQLFYIYPQLEVEAILGLTCMKENQWKLDFSKTKISILQQDQNISKNLEPEEYLEARIKTATIEMNKNATAEIFEDINLNRVIQEAKNNNPPLGKIKCQPLKLSYKSTANVVKLKPYKVPYAILPKLKKMIAKMIDMNIIRKSNSEYASPAFVIPKKNGEIRMVVNYKKLNENLISFLSHFLICMIYYYH